MIALVNDDCDDGEEAGEEEKLDKSTDDKFEFKNNDSFSQNSNLGNSNIDEP